MVNLLYMFFYVVVGCSRTNTFCSKIEDISPLTFWKPWKAILGILRPAWANIDASWGPLGPTSTNMNQRDPTWSNRSQHKDSVSEHKTNISNINPNWSQHTSQKIKGTHLKGTVRRKRRILWGEFGLAFGLEFWSFWEVWETTLASWGLLCLDES